VFHTLDRLPKEFKLAGIATVEAANVWPREIFIAEHNKRCVIEAEQDGSALWSMRWRLGEISSESRKTE
jgi:hypothetical protein